MAAAALVAAMGMVASSCGIFGGSSGVQSVSVFHLTVGQCLVPPKKIQADLTSIDVVSCTTKHTQEVYALAKDPGGSGYPTATKLNGFAKAACLDHFSGYVGIPYQQSTLYFTYLLPSVLSWADGDRTVVCVVESVTGPLKRSVKGSKI